MILVTNLMNEFVDGFNTMQQYPVVVERNGFGRTTHRELLSVICIPHFGHNLHPIIGDFVIQHQSQILWCTTSKDFIIDEITTYRY